MYLRHKNVNVVFWCHGFDVTQTRIACSHVFCMWQSSNTTNKWWWRRRRDTRRMRCHHFLFILPLYCLAINNFLSLTWLIAFNIDPLPLISDYMYWMCIPAQSKDNEKRRLHVHRHTHKELLHFDQIGCAFRTPAQYICIVVLIP